MNLANAFSKAKELYEQILATTSCVYTWYSVDFGNDYGETNQGNYTLHPTYPEIEAIVSPASSSDTIVFPLRLEDYSHVGSTLLIYTIDPGLEEYRRLKRNDKLVSSLDGSVYSVVTAHPATMDTHTIFGAIRDYSWRYSPDT